MIRVIGINRDSRSPCGDDYEDGTHLSACSNPAHFFHASYALTSNTRYTSVQTLQLRSVRSPPYPNMSSFRISSLFLLAAAALGTYATKTCNVLDYGGIADDATDIGPAITKAYVDCGSRRLTSIPVDTILVPSGTHPVKTSVKSVNNILPSRLVESLIASLTRRLREMCSCSIVVIIASERVDIRVCGESVDDVGAVVMWNGNGTIYGYSDPPNNKCNFSDDLGLWLCITV